ncbi:MAG: tRNA(fMet)-specific endonuclease VapC [Chloroflexi bacterium ADurb.Bin360]|nr:MAG: tRNA(fMet)-specific endonuclease VapC [Chloroflexi bacterium ADurb.Bin360]
MVTPYFFDSSALVKRYITESGTRWVTALTAPESAHSLLIARITWVEILSALARQQREGAVTAVQLLQAVQSFRYDLDTQYQVVELTPDLAEYAGHLVRAYPLRAYDAIQLAAALRVQAVLARAHATPLTFVCADERLLTVAQSAGLRVANPNTTP